MKTLAQFKKSVNSVTKAEGTVRERYQNLGIAAMQQLKDHGNTEWLTYLYVSMVGTNTPYCKTMLKWMKTFAPIASKKDKEFKFVVRPVKPGSKQKVDHKTTDVAGAEKIKFWMIDGGQRLEEFDAYGVLCGLLKREEKALSEPDKFGKVIPFTEGQRKRLTEMRDTMAKARQAEKEQVAAG